MHDGETEQLGSQMNRAVGSFSVQGSKNKLMSESVVPNHLCVTGVPWDLVSSMARRPHGGRGVWNPSTQTRQDGAWPENEESVRACVHEAGNLSCTPEPLFKAVE